MSKEQELDDFLLILNEYAKKVGINRFQNKGDVDSILESTESERELLSEIELINKAFTLHNYGAYIQRCINQQQIKLKWAQANIRVLYGRETPKYDRFSYQEKQDATIANDSSIFTLHKIIMNAETRIAQLYDISKFISNMANDLVEMAKTKRSHKYEK